MVPVFSTSSLSLSSVSLPLPLPLELRLETSLSELREMLTEPSGDEGLFFPEALAFAPIGGRVGLGDGELGDIDFVPFVMLDPTVLLVRPSVSLSSSDSMMNSALSVEILSTVLAPFNFGLSLLVDFAVNGSFGDDLDWLGCFMVGLPTLYGLLISETFQSQSQVLQVLRRMLGNRG